MKSMGKWFEATRSATQLSFSLETNPKMQRSSKSTQARSRRLRSNLGGLSSIRGLEVVAKRLVDLVLTDQPGYQSRSDQLFDDRPAPKGRGTKNGAHRLL
jgi:hypothetical protein